MQRVRRGLLRFVVLNTARAGVIPHGRGTGGMGRIRSIAKNVCSADTTIMVLNDVMSPRLTKLRAGLQHLPSGRHRERPHTGIAMRAFRPQRRTGEGSAI